MRVLRVCCVVILLACLSLAKDPVSDDTIYDKVRIQLANDREIGGNAIDVKVAEGQVELVGKVKTEKQRMKAEKVARKVKGVKNVVNNLTVSPV